LDTDADGHFPADSICDVQLQVITIHRVLHIFYIGVNILSTSSAPDVIFFHFFFHKGKLYSTWSGIECLLAAINSSNLWELILKPFMPTDSHAVAQLSMPVFNCCLYETSATGLCHQVLPS